MTTPERLHNVPTDAIYKAEMGFAPTDGVLVNYAGTLYLRDAGTWVAQESGSSAAGGDLLGTYPNPTINPAATALTSTFVAKGKLAFDPRDYGAVGDGVIDDTTAVQSAATAAGAANGYLFIGKPFSVGLVTLPAGCRGVYGPGKLIQKAADTNLLDASAPTGCVISGVTFQGVAGTVLASSNEAITATNPTRLTIEDCTFLNWRDDAVHILGGTDVRVARNSIYSCSHGIFFQGVLRGWIVDNTVRDPQTPASTFTVAISLDSTQGNSNPVPQDIVIKGNVVKSYVNGQGVLVHAGQRITIADNVLDDCLEGIAVNGVVAGDTIRDIAILGNVYLGTSTIGGAANANNGITLQGGSPTPNPDHITIVGNAIDNANAIRKNAFSGGIVLGYASQVIVAANTIRNCTCNGVGVVNPLTDCVIRDNTIDGVVVDSGNQQGIEFNGGSTGSSGWIDRNVIDGGAGLQSGIRNEPACNSPNVRIGSNYFLGTVTTKLDINGTFTSLEQVPGALQLALTKSSLYSGTGAPNNAVGADGDFFFRTDGGALTTVYQRRTGTWAGII